MHKEIPLPVSNLRSFLYNLTLWESLTANNDDAVVVVYLALTPVKAVDIYVFSLLYFTFCRWTFSSLILSREQSFE